MRYPLLIALVVACSYSSNPLPAADPLRLVLDEVHKRYASFLPKTNDPWFEKLKSKVIFYNKEVMPPAYQHAGGVHSPSYNISAAKPQEPFGNANIEFPWGGPGGVDSGSNSTNIKFVYFPPGLAIRAWQAGDLIDWVYPYGTVFGEILMVGDTDDYFHTFEVRIRHLEESGWRVDVYRPYTSPQQLAERLRRLEPAWQSNREVSAFLERLDSSEHLRASSLADRTHDTRAFDRTAVEDELLPLPASLVTKLLDQPFQSVANKKWRTKDGIDGFAPTTKADFHIVPKNYNGAFIAITTKSCMGCHDSVGKHANEFNFRRDWYGYVRGSRSHRIFTFHPFSSASISYNGFSNAPSFNRQLIDAGVLKVE